ncbi:phenylpyruvate tautomerase MIF-related protein [Thioalkalicoccus limnaeus]|uniref:L-dopachrome isomerase n=1 Tax=Thioalkalicoccus limnaeus TaxID=120681 RepID=A0ABV4B919_9GAMM
MPTLRLLTNATVAPETRPELLASASKRVAELLGKPESYVLVILEAGADLLFGGNDEPAAYVELKSIGLPESRTAEFARALCGWLGDALKIDPQRVYIEFSSPPRHLFGWNNATF